MKTSPRLRHFLIAASSLLAASSAFAQSTWNQTATASYVWTNAGNWTGGVPNGAGTVANLNNNVAGVQTITLGTAVIVGTLRFGDSDGSNSFALSNGTGGSLTFNNNGSEALFTHNTGRTSDTFTASITLVDNLQTNIGIDMTMGSTIASSGTRSFTKTGSGALTLSSGSISVSGTTTVSAGSLILSNTSATMGGDISIAGGATLTRSGTGSYTLASGKFVEGSSTGTATFNTGTGSTEGVIAVGNNIFRHTGAGTLKLNRVDIRGTGNEMTGGNIQSGTDGARRGLIVGNTTSGTFTISGGSWTSTGAGAFTDAIGVVNDAAEGTLIISGGAYTTNGLNFGTANTNNPGGTLRITSGSATIGNLIFNSNSSGGKGIVELNSGGTLSLGAITSTSGQTRRFDFNGGQFIATGNVNFGSSLTALNVQNGGALINTNGNSVTVDRALVNNGTGGLTKSGAGTLTLSAANTYTGATSITGGSLALSGSGSIANSSTITINSSTSLDVTGLTGNFTVGASQSLGGSGTIISTTGKTVIASGTLSPGNSPGTLTQDGGTLQLGVGGDLNWQVYDANAPAGIGGYDTVSLINGATLDLSLLSAGNTFNINLWSLSAIGSDVNGNAIDFNNTLNQAWTLFSTGNAITGGFDTSKFTINTGSFNGTSGFTNTLNGSFNVALADGGTDLVLTYTAVPEPAAAFLGSLGLLALLRRRR